MKIQKHKKRLSNKLPVLITVLVLFIAAGLVMSYYIHHNRPPESSDTSGTIKNPSPAQQAEQKRSNLDNKKSAIENTSTNTQSIQPTNSPDSVQIQAIRQNENVIVSTKLLNFPDGVCDLAIAVGTQTKHYTTNILYQPEYSACTGYSIPVSDFSMGDWRLTLTATTAAGTQIQNTIHLMVN